MRSIDGRYVKGVSYSPATQFRKGQHWRTPQAFRDRAWLTEQYVDKKRSCSDIAADFGVTDSAITFWMDRHNIPRRSVSEARKCAKLPDVSGPRNPMYGRTGASNPRWRGGLTPLRQQMYTSLDWKRLKRIVFKRDGGKCVLCASADDLEYHHIIPFSKAPLLALEPDNVTLVCGGCHKKMAGKEGRWKKKLFALIAGKDKPVR